jgi:hypothetical protein
MTRHDDSHRIRPTGLRDGARGLWAIDRACNVEIRTGFTGRDRKQLIPYCSLELGAVEVDGNRIVEALSGDLVEHRGELLF